RHEAPLDMTLRPGGSRFRPANPLALTTSPSALGGTSRVAIQLPDVRVAVAPAAAQRSKAVAVGGKLLYPNVAPDTDFVVAPQPAGVEAGYMLRTAASPTELALHLA